MGDFNVDKTIEKRTLLHDENYKLIHLKLSQQSMKQSNTESINLL